MSARDDTPPKRSLKQRLKDTVKNAADAAVELVKSVVHFDALAKFKDGPNEIDFPIDFGHDTVWATQQQMADLFGVDQSVVARHIRSAFESGELDETEATHAKIASVRNEGDRQVSRSISHYSLDVVLAVGYKVNSKKATAFRKWASTVLKGYIEDGYALNGKRLNSDPAALLRLAQEVRAIRTSEKNLYTQVRETFAQCAIDYDKDDPAARTFFATSQDVFHFAAAAQTAVQIIMSRADASKPQMGLTSVGNKMPTASDVTIAKNYCSDVELRKMEIIGEAWLLYAEGMAMQGKQVSMERLLAKLTDLVKTHEFPVFPGYRGGPTRAQANEHAKGQLELFKKSVRKGLPPGGAAP